MKPKKQWETRKIKKSCFLYILFLICYLLFTYICNYMIIKYLQKMYLDLRSFEGLRQAPDKRSIHKSSTHPLNPFGLSARECNCKISDLFPISLIHKQIFNWEYMLKGVSITLRDTKKMGQNVRRMDIYCNFTPKINQQ